MAEKYVSLQLQGWDAPNKADEFIEWLNKKVDEQPVPREEIDIEIDTDYDYDSSYGVLTLSYTREETAEEERERIDRDKQAKDAKRLMYERLKKELGE